MTYLTTLLRDLIGKWNEAGDNAKWYVIKCHVCTGCALSSLINTINVPNKIDIECMISEPNSTKWKWESRNSLNLCWY